MANALEGVRIIDFTSHLSGPFCTMLLSDMGADVVKVERPGLGDESRKSAPYVNGVSAFNMQANRNKRSVVLDLKTEQGRADCQRLIDSADVVVENYKPGTMEKLGFGYEALKKRNPRLIYTAISGFGQTGPYSHRGGFDLMAQAMSGLMSICGEVNGDPLRLPIPISDLTGGMYGALGTLNALYARERTGKGQLVDVSLFESALSFSPYEVSGFFATGQRPKRIGATHRNAAPYQNYRTVDGWLALGAATQVLWLKFCDEVIKAPDLPKDPRFETNALRIQNNAALSEIVTQYLSKETTGHWLALLEKAGIPAAPVLAYDEVLNDPHFLARDQVESVEHPVAGSTKLLRTPIKFSETPVSIRRPAPTLGQHTDEVLAELNGAKKKSATR